MIRSDDEVDTPSEPFPVLGLSTPATYFRDTGPDAGSAHFGDFVDMVIPVALVLLSERNCRVVTAQPIGVARGRDLRVAVPGARRSSLHVGQPL